MVIFGGIRKKSPKCSELITAGLDSGATRTLPLDEQFWSVSGEACHGDEPGRMGQDTRGWRWDFWQGFQQPAPKGIARLKAPTRFSYVINYPFGAFSDRQPSESARIIPFCPQHCGATPDALRVVSQCCREERNGQFFVGKVFFARQRRRRFAPVGIMAEAPLSRQYLQLPRPRLQALRFV